MIIFLHGDDTYRSREKLRELRERFLREVDPSGMNLAAIDGATAEASEIWGAIAAQSFLVRKRMVVVEDIGAAKSDAVRGEVALFLPKVPEDVVAVFWEAASCKPTAASRADVGAGPRPRPRKGKAKQIGTSATKKPDPLFPLLLKEKYAQEFKPLTGAELERWVVAYATTHGTTFAPGACRELCAIVGGDLWRMAQEVDKLALASHASREISPPKADAPQAQNLSAKGGCASGAKSQISNFSPPSSLIPIPSNLITSLIATAPTDDIFAFVDALGRGDQAAAIRELQRLEAKEQKPEYLITMIARQLRLLCIAADCIARGETSAATVAALGGSPFVARKMLEQARRHSLASLRALYPKLLDLDLALKSSRASKQALLEVFVLEATTPVA